LFTGQDGTGLFEHGKKLTQDEKTWCICKGSGGAGIKGLTSSQSFLNSTGHKGGRKMRNEEKNMRDKEVKRRTKRDKESARNCV
jgi:hypothetical protein